MASISIRSIPDELHRKIKRLQLDYEDCGVKITLEEIYIDAINIGIEEVKQKVEKLQKEKPAK